MGYLASYYTYGLPTFLVIVIALYLLFTGTESQVLSLLLGR
jgi:V-type H+-transporting ATPase proteolipid subunit